MEMRDVLLSLVALLNACCGVVGVEFAQVVRDVMAEQASFLDAR